MSPGSDDDIKGATKKLSELETKVNTTVEMQHWAFWNIFLSVSRHWCKKSCFKCTPDKSYLWHQTLEHPGALPHQYSIFHFWGSGGLISLVMRWESSSILKIVFWLAYSLFIAVWGLYKTLTVHWAFKWTFINILEVYCHCFCHLTTFPTSVGEGKFHSWGRCTMAWCNMHSSWLSMAFFGSTDSVNPLRCIIECIHSVPSSSYKVDNNMHVICKKISVTRLSLIWRWEHYQCFNQTVIIIPYSGKIWRGI